MLYNAINQSYLQKCAGYYSCHKNRSAAKCVVKDGQCITAYPPSGNTLRDLCGDACGSVNNPWGVSDNERHTREIQGVGCVKIFAEDHTHEVTKNHLNKRQIGAFALWDVCTESGKIATAVTVPSTKTKDLSHAAIQLSKRNTFNPSVMCSNRWPTKDDYWSLLFPNNNFVGRLGLFHFQQRIIKTLRKKHTDYYLAIKGLLASICAYNETDYENVLRVLKDGTLNGKKHTEEEIANLQETKYFRKRYGKCIRKEIRPPTSMNQRLDDWFVRYKVTSSEGSRPALGRLDPVTKESLFTADTKAAVDNCKEKSKYLQDLLPLDEMCTTIPPHPNSPHGLPEHLSLRGESNLEAFHGLLSHFANSGMRTALADALNLAGTARYNVAIGHKHRIARSVLVQALQEERKRIPASWETVVSFTNHSELAYVNRLAQQAGIQEPPFPCAETLQEDNGERFFAAYLKWLRNEKPMVDPTNDLCLCCSCIGQVAASPNRANNPPVNDSEIPETGDDIQAMTPQMLAQVPQPSVQQQPRRLPQLLPVLPCMPQFLPLQLMNPSMTWCNPYMTPYSS